MAPLPVVALVGRPNVGKSTLFNALTRSRDALVADLPGLTRDRQHGLVQGFGRSAAVVDTGGLVDAEGLEGIEDLVSRQAWRAVDEAHVVVFLVDGRAGLNPADEAIAHRLRRGGKPVVVAVNKTEGFEDSGVCGEFYTLGLGDPVAISAQQRRGLGPLMDRVLAHCPPVLEAPDGPEPQPNDPLRLAVVGRPNVGKSTLINRLVGEDRLLAFDQPGTTRDSIAVPFERDGQAYILVDTAGVRRRSRVDDRIEKFSIIKTLQAIEGAHGAVVMLDGRSGVVDQDLHLLGLVVDAGRGLVVAVNKWDHLPVEQKSQVRRELERRLGFLTFADVHFISALHGTGVVDVLASLRVACESARRKFSTPELTRLLETVVAQHPPPAVGRGQRIKLRYAHQGGQNPPVIVIHGGRTDQVPISYRRYLTNAFRDALGLKGTPLVVELRSGENPYRPGERRPPKSR